VHLLSTIQQQPNQPWLWDLDVEGPYNQNHEAIVLEMTPRRDTTLLCELRNVCGYSVPTWTCLMLHLRVPLKDVERTRVNVDDFTWRQVPADENVFTFLYANHENADLKDWKLGGGRAGAVLLWPPVLQHFTGCIGHQAPGIL
jgi:hypothetical protein